MPAVATAITTAIITAVTDVGTTTASALLTDKPKAVGLVIANASGLQLNHWKSAIPKRGSLTGAASLQIPTAFTPQAYFEAWKLTKDAPNEVKSIDNVEDLDEAEAILLEGWIAKEIPESGRKPVGEATLEAGWSQEVKWAVVYKSAGEEFAVAVAVKWGHALKYRAACTIADYSWMKGKIRDDKLNELQNNMWKVDSEHTKHTRSSNCVSLQSAPSSPIYSCNLQAAQIAQFTLMPVRCDEL